MSLICLKCKKPELKISHHKTCEKFGEDLLEQADEFFKVADKMLKAEKEWRKARIENGQKPFLNNQDDL